MSGHLIRRMMFLPLALAILSGCRDTDTGTRLLASKPQLAQGDNGTWTVNSLADPGDGTCDDAHCTLREAIAAATSGGQVVFAAGLTGAIQLTAGQLAIVDKDLSINGGGQISVDAQGNSRVLQIQRVAGSRPDVTLTGLTLKNGLTDANGGGIRMSGRNLILDHVTLDGNEATQNGGGVYLVDADVSIRHSTISGNKAASGGGMYVFNGPISVENSTVSGNTAPVGGGISSDGILTLNRSTVSGNSSTGEGGGIYNTGTLTLVSSTVSGNVGRFGGGIYNEAAQVSVRSTTITGNHGFSIFGGGGITDESGTTSMMNSIVAGNTTAGIPGTVTSNCLSSNNGAFTSLGHNVLGGGCLNTVPTDVAVTAAQVYTEVIEQALQDNGGPTETHAAIARGRAIDAGYCPGLSADQRGFTRPVDDPTMPNAADTCDIGAYEAQGPQVAVADLMISQSVDKSSVKQGEMLTYTVRVQNLGPQTAPDVVVNNVLSSGVTFVDVRVNRGMTTAPPMGETGTVTWNLGDLTDQSNEAAEIVVKVLVKGKTTITNTATVSANVSDPNPANNSAAITVSVVAGKAGGKK